MKDDKMKTEAKAELWKEIVSVLSPISEEIRLAVSKDGLRSVCVDPAHVAMLELDVSDDAFDSFEAEEMEIGIEVAKLKEILKLAKPKEAITTDYDEEKNQLVFHIGNIRRRMGLVDTAGMTEPKPPNLTHPAKIIVNTADLKLGIKATQSVDDHVALVCSPDGFEMVSEGDTDSVSMKLPKETLEALECKETVRSLFPLDYFSDLVGAMKGTTVVIMTMGTDYPVRMRFAPFDGKMDVHYLLAPRIESL